MPDARRFKKSLIIGFILTAIVLSSPSLTIADQSSPATLLPADTFLYLVMPEGIPAAQEKLKRTALWGLYKDPAMQQFVVPAEKAIREKIEEGIKKSGKELEIDSLPEKLPYPTGRMILAMRMGTKTRQVPDYDYSAWEDYDPESGEEPPEPVLKGTHEVTEPTAYFVAILDMGQNLDKLKTILTRHAAKAVEKGAKRQQEPFRGLEMEIITYPAPEAPDRPVYAAPQQPDPLCYAFDGQTALLSSNPQLLKDVLARLAGAETDSLADDLAMNNTLRALDAPGDAYFYLNIASLINSLKATAKPEEQPEVDKVMNALGFDNVVGLGIVAQLAPTDAEELRFKGLLTIDGPKRGIPAIITPASASTTGHRLLTRGLASFSVANYDPAQIYNHIAQIVQTISGKNMDMMVQQMMTMTTMNDPEGRPPVDLHKEIIDQLGSPLTVMTRFDQPYTDPKASRTSVALGVRDPAVLDTALGRIHKAIFAGNKDLRRELLGTNIFILKGIPMLDMMMGGMPSDEPENPNLDDTAMALAVTGSNLVIGRVSAVEQAVRNQRRTDLESIQTDLMYSHASRFLPAQAGAWGYENYQTAAELVWVQLKDAASKAGEESDDEDEEGFDSFFGAFGAFPTKELVEELEGICDFNTLPDFATVRKYFGAGLSYLEGTDDGIWFESVIIKAPPSQ